ncbi:GNAT family N-acetyltransferase [Deinococcus maricopensis]|uniref:GCN5-related N-acetyltransferase n=1 Tax=Deinococcus maricopensis (strain DSM 21211 / LMG 22137 / NRRL B-23946 / LB-34) TaxID=709986 RepID=E8U6B1_DEIML|nr:GNAT family N-acetyltransferase [Deinococcus maricopensis]ADV66600.1 GCN5-related N-acetyltransferase [Deinococcus maricopensis DSM 21211]
MTPAAPLTLRAATPDDAPAFHAVMMAAGMDPRSSWTRTTEAQLHAALSAPGAGGFIALDGTQALGIVGYRPDGHATLTLNKLAVRPEARGRGLGRQLVQAVERVAARGGYARVLLAVSQYNQSVLPLYAHLGYSVNPDARYAFASPLSPAPVVLVKAITGVPDGYTLRAATPDDASVIATQRERMFEDMGAPYGPGHTARFGPWVTDRLRSGTYLGFLIDHAAQAVAGAGLMLLDWPPGHLDAATHRAYLLNVYVQPQHRARGLARALVHAATRETRARGLRVLTLHASDAGRPLYEHLGFEPTNEMRLTLTEDQ